MSFKLCSILSSVMEYFSARPCPSWDKLSLCLCVHTQCASTHPLAIHLPLVSRLTGASVLEFSKMHTQQTNAPSQSPCRSRSSVLAHRHGRISQHKLCAFPHCHKKCNARRCLERRNRPHSYNINKASCSISPSSSTYRNYPCILFIKEMSPYTYTYTENRIPYNLSFQAFSGSFDTHSSVDLRNYRRVN